MFMADHAVCSFLTRTFLLVRDADECPAHGPEFFVVVTLGGHKGWSYFMEEIKSGQWFIHILRVAPSFNS